MSIGKRGLLRPLFVVSCATACNRTVIQGSCPTSSVPGLLACQVNQMEAI